MSQSSRHAFQVLGKTTMTSCFPAYFIRSLLPVLVSWQWGNQEYIWNTLKPLKHWFVGKSLSNRVDTLWKFALCDWEWNLCPCPATGAVIFTRIKSHELKEAQTQNETRETPLISSFPVILTELMLRTRPPSQIPLCSWSTSSASSTKYIC